jgi:hypothetical protein
VTSDWPAERRAIIRDAIGIGIAVAAYGFVFGAQGVATGLSLAQTMALSLLMFTGASQFALVGVLGAGGTGVAAALTALAGESWMTIATGSFEHSDGATTIDLQPNVAGRAQRCGIGSPGSGAEGWRFRM